MANFENKAKGLYSVAKVPDDTQYAFNGKGSFAHDVNDKRMLIWHTAKLDHKNISNDGNLMSLNYVDLDEKDMDKANALLKKLTDTKLSELYSHSRS